MTITWNNRACVIDDVPAWSAIQGSHTLSRAAFLAEVRDFNERLIAQMSERVASVCREWRRPEINIDFDALQREHAERALAFEQALATPIEPEDWTAILEAIDYYARMPGDGAHGC